jgi:hypothetical protein
MIRLWAIRIALLLLTVAQPRTLHAQAAAGPSFAALPTHPPFASVRLGPEERADVGLTEFAARSKGGHAALVGGLVGAGVGVLAAVFTNGMCKDSETMTDCGTKAGLVFGTSVALGAFLGWFLGH